MQVAGKARKTPAKRPAKVKGKVDPAAKGTPAVETPKLVEPLDSDSFKRVMDLIDASTIRGRDAEAVIRLRRELARVAGLLK